MVGSLGWEREARRERQRETRPGGMDQEKTFVVPAAATVSGIKNVVWAGLGSAANQLGSGHDVWNSHSMRPVRRMMIKNKYCT